MDFKLFSLIVFTGIFVVLAILLFIGKGDWLIAGYSRSTDVQKRQFHIQRLRTLLGGASIYAAIVVALGLFIEDASWYPNGLILPMLVVLLILIYTWARRKDSCD